jgi:cytochrome c-type biogenesis protein CcmH
MRYAVLIGVLVATVIAGPATASEQHPTLEEMQGRIMCPTCKGQTLDESTAPAADRVRAFIAARIAAGDSRSEIEDKLVAEYGEAILASPPRHGFGLLAWVLTIAGLAVGAIVVGLLARRWSRSRDAPGEPLPGSHGAVQLDPEAERRVDEALARFD